MGENDQGTFYQPDPVDSSAAASLECLRDEFQGQNSFAAESFRPFSLCDDVDLLHGFPQEFTVQYGCGMSDYDPRAQEHPRGKRLKRTPVFAEFYIQDQREMANVEECFVSMVLWRNLLFLIFLFVFRDHCVRTVPSSGGAAIIRGKL